MRVLSVDPGYDRLGIAVVDRRNGKEVLIYSDCFNTKKEHEYAERLGSIAKEFSRLVKKFDPDVFASESLFFTKNQKTAIDVAGCRGVLFYEAKKLGLEIYEFTPLEIKMAVTGYGKSDKKQVKDMVKKLIEIEKDIRLDDEYDAIAVGLTCLATI